MKAGLKEQFVEENGEAASTSEEDTEENHSTENDIHSSRYSQWEFIATFCSSTM